MKKLSGRVIAGAASLAVLLGAGSMAYAANSWNYNFQVAAGGARACANVAHLATSSMAPNVYVFLESISPSSVPYGWLGVANTSCVPISPVYETYPNSSDTIQSADYAGEYIKMTAETPANDPYGTTYIGNAKS